VGYMRHAAAEKLEIIRLVEQSSLPGPAHLGAARHPAYVRPGTIAIAPVRLKACAIAFGPQKYSTRI
jgi:hypothetical protein